MRNAFTWQGKTYEAFDFCELTHSVSALPLAAYEKDFYQGMPALTVNEFGRGRCYYIAARTGEDFLMDFYRHVAGEAGLAPLVPNLPQGMGVTGRVGENGREYLFLMNYLPTENSLTLPDKRLDLLSGKIISGTVTLPPRGVLVLCPE
jgi:beta-galactosidase